MNASRAHRLRTRLAQPAGERPFLLLAELLPAGGTDVANIERFLRGYADRKDALPAGLRLAGVAIPQNPRGVASLSPADVFALLDRQGLWGDLDVVAHASAKDANADALKTYLLGLEKLGLESVLAVTGDKPSTGKGVFDVDSLGLLELVRDMNFESFRRAAPGRFDEVHQFFALAAVSPFKYTEASQMQQYFKMKKKVRAGAAALIAQLGWDARKSEELFRYLREEGLDVPVFGNVFVLSGTTPVPRLMAEGRMPGCVVTRDLLRTTQSEPKTAPLERAAVQLAMFRDLGAAGADIGGLACFDDLLAVAARAAEIGAGWRDHRAAVEFGVSALPGGRAPFYLYDREGRRSVPSRPKPGFHKRTFDLMHRTLLTRGRALNPAVTALLGASRRLREGRGFLYEGFLGWEKGVKSLLYRCEECGDCFLPENFGRCTIGECAKGLANVPCGDAAPDGRCGNDLSRVCVGESVYQAAASEGPAGLKALAGRINPPRRPDLQGTASVLNYLFGRDHAGRPGLIQIGENVHASIPKTHAAMQELIDLGPGALERPGAALAYIVSLIREQVKHRADYIDINVDAFGDSDLEFRMRLMRDFVRLVRRTSDGVPVCVDSGSPEVLRAGLEAWYEDAPPGLASPLLNSVKIYTMDKVLPLRSRYRFRVIGLLVDDASAGREGVYGVDELCALGRKLFAAAVKTYGFAPGDVFLDSTVFPLSIDMPMAADKPGYTYRTFETIRRLKADPALKGVHFSLGITNAVRDLPGRSTGVCRAYLATAQRFGLDAAIVNPMHDFGLRPPAPELMEFVAAFARQDGSPAAGQKVIDTMMNFCRTNRRPARG